MFLILTDSYHATKYHNQLIRAGARGFCLKSSGPRTLFEAIEQVTRALPYTDPKITQLVKQTPTTNMPNSNLTDREIEVLIRLDLRNKEIAEELDMKLRTVEKHIECILAKLKVPTRTAAALKAVQLGYVLLPKMPGRDPVTGVSHEQTVAELQAELAIANEHLKALLRQNELLKQALNDKMQSPNQAPARPPYSPTRDEQQLQQQQQPQPQRPPYSPTRDEQQARLQQQQQRPALQSLQSFQLARRRQVSPGN